MCMEQIDPKGNYTGQKMIDFGIFRFRDGREREREKALKVMGDMKRFIEEIEKEVDGECGGCPICGVDRDWETSRS